MGKAHAKENQNPEEIAKILWPRSVGFAQGSDRDLGPVLGRITARRSVDTGVFSQFTHLLAKVNCYENTPKNIYLSDLRIQKRMADS